MKNSLKYGTLCKYGKNRCMSYSINMHYTYNLNMMEYIFVFRSLRFLL